MEKKNDKQEELKNTIVNLAESFKDNPENIAELFQFGSQFYMYSVRNNMLIYAQNKYATFVQSFVAWKELDANVQKGEKGIGIWVPVQATYVKQGDEFVQLRYASKQIKEQYKQDKNALESYQKMHFKVGYVFDISQTDYPKEKYPELYQMGKEDLNSQRIIDGLKTFSKDNLQCPVIEENLNSISLRGYYSPGGNNLTLNRLLEDTEKASTLSHELGHAILHNLKEENKNKTLSQIEFEADAVSIMISSKYGLELTDSRKRHLADHYKKMVASFEKEQNKSDGKEQEQAQVKDAKIDKVFENIFSTFNYYREELDRHIDYAIEKSKRIENGKAAAQIDKVKTPNKAVKRTISNEMEL